MIVAEDHAKQILAHYGLQTPSGRVAHTPDEAAAIAEKLGGAAVVKALVPSGGRDPDSVGDPTMLAREVPLTPLWEIARQFGDVFAGNLGRSRARKVGWADSIGLRVAPRAREPERGRGGARPAGDP